MWYVHVYDPLHRISACAIGIMSSHEKSDVDVHTVSD